MTVGMRMVGSGLDHPEGVAWSSSHGLVAGGEAGQVYRVDLATGAHTQVADTGGYVLGLAFGPDGRLYACDMGRRAVLAIDLASGTVEDVSTGRGPELRVPNHLAFTEDGDLFVSDSGEWGASTGRILRYAAGFTEGAVVSESANRYPNGLALDGEWLYVVETAGPAIVRLPISRGGLGEPELVVEMERTVPDGIALTTDGSLLVACFRPDAVFRWDVGSGLRLLVEDWRGMALSAPTNLVFAAGDRLVTANLAGGHLTEIQDSGLAGRPLPFSTA